MNTDRQKPLDETEALAQKLFEALQENKTLRDRIAELDIAMNIDAVELKKSIEALEREKHEITEENEFLLEDYMAKDHKIQELTRQIEIKQLMINETSSYLGTATDRIKNLEMQCSTLEAQFEKVSDHLKRDNETLKKENDELARNNASLLLSSTSTDHDMQELLKQLEIKQLTIDETKAYLSTATGRIKNLEMQCSTLEAHYAEMYGKLTPSEKPDKAAYGPERGKALIEDIRKEFEETLDQKDAEIETLHRDMEILKEQNTLLETEKTHGDSEGSAPCEVSASLENTLLEMEHALSGLQQRISSASEISIAEKEEILNKLDDAHREIFSLREYHRSLLEALRKTDEDACKTVFSLSDYHRSILQESRAMEIEHTLLKTDMAGMITSLHEKEETIIELRNRIEHEIQESSSSKQEFEEKLVSAEKIVTQLEGALVHERTKLSLLEEAMQHKEMLLKELNEHIESDTERLKEELAGAKQAAERAEHQIILLETIAADGDSQIEALNARITEQQTFSASKIQEAAELAEQCRHLEEHLRASQEELSKLQNILRLRDHELEILACRKEELDTELGNATTLLAQQKDFRNLTEHAEGQIRSLKDIIEQNNSDIENLNAQLAEQKSLNELKSREVSELTEKYSHSEEEHQRFIRASEDNISELQSFINLRDRELEVLARKQAELEEKLSTAATELERQKSISAAQDHADDEVQKLKEIISRSNSDIEALTLQVAEHQAVVGAKDRETEELAAKCSRIEEDHRRLIKASEDYIGALQNTISLRDQELEVIASRQAELEKELSNAARVLTPKDIVTSSPNSAPLQDKEIKELRQANEGLSSRLTEALQRSDMMQEMGNSVSLEIRRLADSMASLKNEELENRTALKNDMDRSFSLITESTERLQHAISEGIPIIKKLEEISSEILKGDIPAVYTAIPQEPEQGRSRALGIKTAALVFLLFLLLAAAIFFRADVYRIISAKGLLASAPKKMQWETGTKQTKKGHYEAVLTFLTKEAVQVLGFSDIIPDASLLQNTFALIEIRNAEGCISEDFVASPEKNMSFIDRNGKEIPLNDPGTLAGWKKTVYKQNACNGSKAGTIYLKHIISAVKGAELNGLAIRGLAGETILLQ